ncbi:FAD:protein FMN transferase [Bradyrhizobium sp. HKCCYLS20291]|uniref:FAD:protein FMN transferase n=1 Tax=Bradyrhizobium sp. HKCCYLS20291 TaxID=3420766 RepID=UPI003EBBF4F4
MTNTRPTRRRAIRILAGAACAATAGPAARPARADFAWHGIAMGADATILFSEVGDSEARSTCRLVESEIDRLEGALSLFRSDSELSVLNRASVLHAPSGDLRRAIGLALQVAAATRGLFDPTVQPLWEAHVDWFARHPDGGLPPEEVIAQARSAVDWRRVRQDDGTIRLGDGQRLTLNGLGQGYVTDRIAQLLMARGFENVLVDLGEQRALGPQRDGSPWLVSRSPSAPLTLGGGALATSEGIGCVLGAHGAAHHLFDPRTGRSAPHWRRVTVHHPSAAIADALSTAFFIAASREELVVASQAFPDASIWVLDAASQEHHWPCATGGAGPPARI